MKKVMRLMAIILALGMGGEIKKEASPADQSLSGLKNSNGQVPMRAQVDLDFGRMPVYFIASQGQMDEQVAFYVQGKDKSLYFTSEGMTVALNGSLSEKDRHDSGVPFSPGNRDLERKKIEAGSDSRWVVKVYFLGANRDVSPLGVEKTEAVISYFRGKPEEWRTGLPTYSKIIYKNLWPGIDLTYSGTVDKLKYEFIVHPGGDPGKIRLGYRGASDVKVDGEGRLRVTTPQGSFSDDVPVAYQEVEGKRLSVGIAYELSAVEHGGYVCGFRMGDYNPERPLIIDPVVLVYCGYIGGSGDDFGCGIAVDRFGNAYVTGLIFSTNATFPEKVGPDLIFNGKTDAFVAKVNASGTGLVYCGYIGGSGDDAGRGIAVDGSGNAYVSGDTSSTEATFPVTVGPDLTQNGSWDAFVAKVNASGTGLVYCGYIGGADYDDGRGIAVDRSGNAYVTGGTQSTEATFPVTVGPDLTHNGGLDAFVAKVNASGTNLVYCGYIGGSGNDVGWGISVDKTGNAYVAGHTMSTESTFPVKVGPDLSQNDSWDAFVAKVKASGASLVYCGYIGGSSDEYGWGIAVDKSGDAYVTGLTNSTQETFPISIGPDLIYNGKKDAFVAKVGVRKKSR
jgi:hypothetical protein